MRGMYGPKFIDEALRSLIGTEATTLTKGTTVEFSLHASDLMGGEDGYGFVTSTIFTTEVTAPDYAPLVVDMADTTVADGIFQATVNLVFTAAAANDWGLVSTVACWFGTGRTVDDLICAVELTTPKTVLTGDNAIIDAGNLTMRVNRLSIYGDQPAPVTP